MIRVRVVAAKNIRSVADEVDNINLERAASAKG